MAWAGFKKESVRNTKHTLWSAFREWTTLAFLVHKFARMLISALEIDRKVLSVCLIDHGEKTRCGANHKLCVKCILQQFAGALKCLGTCVYAKLRMRQFSRCAGTID